MIKNSKNRFFHITSLENLSKIMSSGGLVPQIGSRSLQDGQTVPRIYTLHSIEDVQQALSIWFKEALNNQALCLLQIDLPDNFDIRQDGKECWWITEHSIASYYITVHTNIGEFCQ